MPVGGLIAGGLGLAGSIGSSLIGANAAKSASEAQQSLGQQSLAQILQMFKTAQGVVQPVIDAGGNIVQQGGNILNKGQGIVDSASATLKSLLTPGANMTETLSKIPGFQFAQDWGQKAVQNMGTTMGLGGNVLKAGADYATGAAQQGFGSIVSQLQALLGGGINLSNTGSGLIGTGAGTEASGANALAGAATSTGATAGQTLTGIGNAQASGILGSANALSTGIQGGTNAISNSLLLSKLFGGGSPGVTSAGGIYGAIGPTSVGGAPLVG